MDYVAKYRNAAALARAHGDPINAAWLDAQADHHDAATATEMDRQLADTECLKGSPEHG